MSSLSALAIVENNLVDHVTFIQRHSAGMRVEPCAGGWLVDSALASDTFNKVLLPCVGACGPSAAELSRVIAACLPKVSAYFAGTERPFTVWTGGESFMPSVDAAFLQQGFALAESETAMVLHRAQVDSAMDASIRDSAFAAGFKVLRVQNSAVLQDFASVLAHNWTPPDADVATFYAQAAPCLLADGSPMQLYVGYVGDVPVTCCELYMSQDHVAGVHMLSTLPAWRRQGLGSVTMRHVLCMAKHNEVERVVLLASETGLPLYTTLGFVPCGSFMEYNATQKENLDILI